jgi:hypothetical protein
MHRETVIAYFGSASQVAQFLNISRAAVAKWPDIIPEGSAYKLEVMTDGNLKVDPSLYQTAAA